MHTALKIIDYIVLNIFSSNNQLPICQHGFIFGKSANTGLADLAEHIITVLRIDEKE